MNPKKRKYLRATQQTRVSAYMAIGAGGRYSCPSGMEFNLLNANCNLTVVNCTARALLTVSAAMTWDTHWIRRRVFSRPAPDLTKRENCWIIVTALLYGSGNNIKQYTLDGIGVELVCQKAWKRASLISTSSVAYSACACSKTQYIHRCELIYMQSDINYCLEWFIRGTLGMIEVASSCVLERERYI